MNVRLAVTVPLEIAHCGLDGIMHGHSLSIEVWTTQSMDLDEWREAIRNGIAHIAFKPLEQTIGGRTFEDVAAAVLAALPKASQVCIRLPTQGFAVEACR